MWRTNGPSNTGGILPATTYTGSWGVSTLYAQDGTQQFYWKVSPYDSENYVYTMEINLYSNTFEPTYYGSIEVGTGGVGPQSGFVSYSQTDLGPGQYYATLTGTFAGSDTTEGTVGGDAGSASCVFNIGTII